jgi:hypothetical protein
MSLLEEYPKMHRNATPRLRALLERVPGLGAREREDIAMWVNDMADKAHDLNEIFTRLVEGDRSSDELGELFIVFALTAEQLRGTSDLLDGKLYDVGDRLKTTTQRQLE